MTGGDVFDHHRDAEFPEEHPDGATGATGATGALEKPTGSTSGVIKHGESPEKNAGLESCKNHPVMASFNENLHLWKLSS